MPLLDHQWLKREAVKALLRPGVSWRPLEDPKPGFSIVLGTPWALRHLLPVNLRFVSRTDLDGLDRLHVVFDRTRRPGAEEFIASITEAFPDLPLDFRFHPRIAGRIVRRADQSKFYASLNWVTGLAACQTRHAILHDFDLYPVAPDFFSRIVDAMRERDLRFSGAEYTHFVKVTMSRTGRPVASRRAFE